jgi:hypothetical protein
LVTGDDDDDDDNDDDDDDDNGGVVVVKKNVDHKWHINVKWFVDKKNTDKS